MIDDATLAEWEQMADRGHPALSTPLLSAITEIRRLREYQEYFAPGVTELQADLAAHRAVIRELAERLDHVAPVGHDINCEYQSEFEDAHKGCPRCIADEGLAHPLVQQAREEGRDAKG